MFTKRPKPGVSGILATTFTMVMAGITSTVHANTDITLIQLSDTHGQMVSHPCVIADSDEISGERYSNACGGLAKLKTLADEIRDEVDNHLTVAVGDTYHGSAEVMFTVGDAITPALNAFGIDVYVPGNWEFGYGPAVFRNRFAPPGVSPMTPPGTLPDQLPYPSPKPPLPANIQVMSGYVNCTDVTGPCSQSPVSAGLKGVIRANFPTVANNLYNNTSGLALPPIIHNKRVLHPFKIFERDGVKIAVIGITASIVPQQAEVFNIGLRFTQGIEELPGNIAAAQADGADVIVVASELGLSQNIQIGRDFEDVDVVLSGHTHEVTLGAILASADEVVATTPNSPLSAAELTMLSNGAAIVVEASEDAFLGRLDLEVNPSGDIVDFAWVAKPADHTVVEDADMAAIVAAAEAPFSGPDRIRHTFMPGGFCPDNDCGNTKKRGLQLTEDLDTVVGNTEVLLHRHDALEDVWNNFIADAVRAVTGPVVASEGTWSGVDLSMTNGFRFGVDILSEGEGGTGEIRLRDLYSHFPISPAIAVAEFSGMAIEKD
ncbi:MAG: bifunctional metallophosphatase/5'-nucleotidase, partial [Planctomycetota bacterium]